MRSLNSIGQQGGGVLIMTLVFLLILTVVVSGASNSSVMQEKMTLAVKDSNVALERAEEALREAEDFIKNTDNATIESKAFFFAPNEAPDPFAAATWVDTDNTPASAAAAPQSAHGFRLDQPLPAGQHQGCSATHFAS